MTKSECLCRRLLDEFGLKVYMLMPATGWYRSAPESESWRWEAWATIESVDKKLDFKPSFLGNKVYLYSDNTITECAQKKRKLQLSRDIRGMWNHFEVSACKALNVAKEVYR